MGLLKTVRLASLCIAITFAVHGHPSAYAAPKLTDAQAKVLIMLNFINKYVDWPGGFNLRQTGYVNVCAYGNDAVTQELPILKQASTANLAVNVYLNQQESYLSRCHVVYIGESSYGSVDQILRLVKDAPVLTVSGASRFIDRGGVVGLTEHIEQQGAFEKTYVRFEVNRKKMTTVQLRLDPDALEMATRVIR